MIIKFQTQTNFLVNSSTLIFFFFFVSGRMNVSNQTFLYECPKKKLKRLFNCWGRVFWRKVHHTMSNEGLTRSCCIYVFRFLRKIFMSFHVFLMGNILDSLRGLVMLLFYYYYDTHTSAHFADKRERNDALLTIYLGICVCVWKEFVLNTFKCS